MTDADETTGTIRLHGEDHTFGNCIRYVLAAQPSTDFVGYSIPHPSEHLINLRLQTRGGVKVREAMEAACSLLEAMCDRMLETFDAAEQEAIAAGRDRGHEDDDDAAAEEHQMEEID
jgi:DNA-directed RNA polymerase I and III subunit RPAC2